MRSLTRRSLLKSSAAAVAAGPLLAAERLARVPDDKLESEFLLNVSLDTESPRDVGEGRRVVPVSGGAFEGPRLKGTVITPGADWILLRPDGSRVLDVRLLFKTDDAQTIYVSWRGIAYDLPAGGGLFARILPVFETAAGKYAWLNNIVSVGIYRPGTGKVAFRVYQIL